VWTLTKDIKKTLNNPSTSRSGNRSTPLQDEIESGNQARATDAGYESDLDTDLDDDEESVSSDDELDQYGDEELEADSELIDDPVRVYLMQMGEIPLLTRQQEIAAAKQIEQTRTLFRYGLLTSELILEGAVNMLRKVRDGELRLDRTIDVSVTDAAEKKLINAVLPPNLETLEKLLAANYRDFRVAINRQQPASVRREAYRKMVRRR